MKLGLITRSKDEPFVEEFCRYYLGQGVDQIHIIDDNSQNKSIYDRIKYHDKIIIHYERDIFERSYANQLFIQLKNQFEWMIHVDMDEFITTKRHKQRTIREELESRFKDVDCIKIPWVMMSPNGRKELPDSILATTTHRWNHDKIHPNPITDHQKFRCRFDQIEVKCIFKAAKFRNMWEHHPDIAIGVEPIVVDGVSGRPAMLNAYYDELREEDIRNGFLLCYHYRVVSEVHARKKLETSGLYKNSHSLEELMSTDYPEILDETMKTKWTHYFMGFQEKV